MRKGVEEGYTMRSFIVCSVDLNYHSGWQGIFSEWKWVAMLSNFFAGNYKKEISEKA